MKRTGFFALVLCTLVACGDNKAPDVSNINIKLSEERFDQDFFKTDTNQLQPSLQRLGQLYPHFLPDYCQNILGLPASPLLDGQSAALLTQFIHDYAPVRDSVNKVFRSTKTYEEAVKKGLQYVKHYFPDYKTPERLIFYIGPMDAIYQASLGAYGDAITSAGLAVGLQLHLGVNNGLYTNDIGRSLYPAYISRRFTPDYIPVNCLKNVIDDIYPEKVAGMTLIEQMVEKGKRLYALDKVLPYTPDTLKIGYSKYQLEGCFKNEGRIWNHFLANSLLLNNDPSYTKSYIGEAPNTPEFGEGSPGSIGYFVGWQLVKKYMEQHKDLTLMALFQTPAMNIYQESKYKPK